MKVQFRNHCNAQISSLNSHYIAKNKRNSVNSYACENSFELISRPDLIFKPTFGAIKKSQLNEYDLACANKFKAPMDKFKSQKDFDIWAEKKLKEKTDLSQYKNNDKTIQDAVRKDLKRWKNYLSSDDLYKNTPALSLIIFNAITEDISHDTHAFPPILHKAVLSKTIGQLKGQMKYDPKSNFNFNKMYQNNLRLAYTKDEVEEIENEDPNVPKTGLWVKIPSKINDPKNFEENVNKLKALSCKSWCTRETHAEEYLSTGDFYVYLENNKPKVGIRFNRNIIAEIQGEQNNQKIPLKYIDKIKSFVEENKFRGCEGVLERAEKANEKIKEIRENFAQDFKDKKYENILKYLGMDVKVLDDGMFELAEFDQPIEFSFEELGLDENELFKKVKTITGDAEFEDSKVTDLGNLESIEKDAYCTNSKFISMGKLRSIVGSVYFQNSKITNLGNLKSIGSNAVFKNSAVRDLGKLETIGGDAYFTHSEISDLGNLKYIGEDAHFNESKITSLGNLEYIGGDAQFKDSKVFDLGKLHTIGRIAFCNEHSKLDFSQIKIGWKSEKN